MKKLTDIQGVIFDYGGTIDTNSRHWAEVLWEKYKELQVPVDKPVFREAYVHGERTLARQPLVKREDNFYDVLRIKTRVQMDWLVENGILPREKAVAENYASRIADACYAYVLEVLKRTRPVVKTLSEHYKLVLVSNFYGNIGTSSSPSSSGKPNKRFIFCTACPAAPFTKLSIAPIIIMRLVRLSIL